MLRLDADDAYLRAQVFDVGRDPGDQPTAADRDENRIQLAGVLAQDFHCHGALPGDHVRVIER
ncbi:hypothetical protein D3C84_1293740 [compost metagenome]